VVCGVWCVVCGLCKYNDSKINLNIHFVVQYPPVWNSIIWRLRYNPLTPTLVKNWSFPVECLVGVLVPVEGLVGVPVGILVVPIEVRVIPEVLVVPVGVL
jgi:hypothetical protein